MMSTQDQATENKSRGATSPDDIPDYEEFKSWTGPRSLVESFRYAVQGIVDVFRTQRHMRFHFATTVLVFLVGLMYRLSRQDMLILLFAVSLVLMAEMFNTALEAVLDIIAPRYHPLVKFAKDAAAGAVLIAASTAVLVGLLLAVGRSGPAASPTVVAAHGPGREVKVIITGLVLFVLIGVIKAMGARGKLLKGGLVSGHTALAFFLAATILFISKPAVTAVIAVSMALLIAQSRLEAKIHSLREVAVGALLALVVTAVAYWIPGALLHH